VDRIVEVAFGRNLALASEVIALGGTIVASDAEPEPRLPFWEMLFKIVTIRLVGSDDLPEVRRRPILRAPVNKAQVYPVGGCAWPSSPQALGPSARTGGRACEAHHRAVDGSHPHVGEERLAGSRRQQWDKWWTTAILRYLGKTLVFHCQVGGGKSAAVFFAKRDDVCGNCRQSSNGACGAGEGRSR